MRTLELRKSGISALGRVEWGAHVCMFYNTVEESLEVVVPYFAAGLRDNEFCMWVTSNPLSVEQAKESLKQLVPDLEDRMSRGQIEILDSSEWYTKPGRFNAETIMNGWVEKLESAFKHGFAGLRLCGYTSWLAEEDWEAFIKYEDEVGDLIERSKVLALCSYSLMKCDARRVIDVVSNHHFALIKRGKDWALVENAERVKAVIATKEIEKRYRRTADNIGVAIYSALPDESSTTLLVSDRIAEITGYTASEFYADSSLFARIVHPDDASMVWDKIREHREKKSELDLDYRIIRKDGAVKWVKDMAHPHLDKAGNIDRIDGFMEDVSERRFTEQALKESRERYALAQKAAKIGSWDLDLTTGALTWSEEIEPMFGFGPGEFDRTYEGFLRCVHPDDRDMVERGVRECLDRGSDYSLDHRIVTPGGAIKWISEKGNAIRDLTGKAVRMLGVAQDITERKLAEERVTELNSELQVLSYAVSHDLRAPLRRIDGFSSLLMEGAKEKEKLGKDEFDYLRRIKSQTESMDQLIDDYLQLSRAGSTEISSVDVDLSGLAQEVADSMQSSEPDRKVKFAATPGLHVRGDRLLLKSVMENLLDNAFKFTRRTKDAKVEFGVSESGGKKAYYVRDNGAGFDRTRADKLFKLGQRLHAATDYEGTGIGLAIVKKIVERHGGKVWADGEEDKGATFYFTLG